ncbi:MAG: serine/threonine transporter SstT [Bilifractor sp.]|nr:serine/threonine transporter SstT [Bilifractor sp.]
MAFLNVLKKAAKKYNDTSLILRILCGIIIGIVLAFVLPGWTWLEILGNLFVGALKAIAPVLVFVLVSGALAQGSSKLDKRFGNVIFLYMLTTFLAAFVAVAASFAFPQTLVLSGVEAAKADTVPQGIGEVMKNLLMNVVSNPVDALVNANYIGILFWAALFGGAMKRFAAENSKKFMANVSEAISQVVRWIINFAPFGIMGLVFNTVHENGLAIFTTYGRLLLLLVGCMAFESLIVNGIVAWVHLRRNPYPLIWKCLKESGLTAFFTRSSAANIPINMSLCKRLGLDEDMYSVSIPLGATINMDGAAITISVMTLACAHTMGIAVDVPTALILSVLSTFAACGASGVAGGSLLLIPMACSLFGISNDIAMQVVAVGFIIGVVQDSVETMLNSSGDVVFAAIAEYRVWLKEGRRLPGFMYTEKEREKMGISKDFRGDTKEVMQEQSIAANSEGEYK